MTNASSSSEACLLCVATEKGLEVVRTATSFPRPFTVCTFEESAVAESFYERITTTAREAGFSVISWKEFRADPVRFLESRSIGSILCIGWRYLIPPNVVRALSGNVTIAHDSLLPKLRGFAPLVNAMISGESETGVTFLRAGDSVDDGEILWQGRVAIEPKDTIHNLIQKVLPLYREGALRYFRGELCKGTPQDDRLATYSLWRDVDDYRIDWQCDAEVIERTVRALGHPYLGARTSLQGKTVVIHEAEVVADLPFVLRQPGKVWTLDRDGCPIVVCGRGLLRIVSATAEGQSILPLRSMRVRFG